MDSSGTCLRSKKRGVEGGVRSTGCKIPARRWAAPTGLHASMSDESDSYHPMRSPWTLQLCRAPGRCSALELRRRVKRSEQETRAAVSGGLGLLPREAGGQLRSTRQDRRTGLSVSGSLKAKGHLYLSLLCPRPIPLSLWLSLRPSGCGGHLGGPVLLGVGRGWEGDIFAVVVWDKEKLE